MPIDTHAADAADTLYRKKTLTKAAQWFCNGHAKPWAQSAVREMGTHFEIDTREGTLRGELGDWIACGPAGEVYPIGKEIFAATYELATASSAPGALADLTVEALSNWLIAHGGIGGWAASSAARALISHSESPFRTLFASSPAASAPPVDGAERERAIAAALDAFQKTRGYHREVIVDLLEDFGGFVTDAILSHPRPAAGAAGLVEDMRLACLRIVEHPNAGLVPPDGGDPTPAEMLANIAADIRALPAALARHATPDGEAADRDDVLFAFHRYVENPTPFEVTWWTRHFPRFAKDIREHAVEVIDMNFRAAHEGAAGSVVVPAGGKPKSFIVRDCACCSDQPTVPPNCPACHGAGGFTRYQIADGIVSTATPQGAGETAGGGTPRTRAHPSLINHRPSDEMLRAALADAEADAGAESSLGGQLLAIAKAWALKTALATAAPEQAGSRGNPLPVMGNEDHAKRALQPGDDYRMVGDPPDMVRRLGNEPPAAARPHSDAEGRS